MENQRNTLYVTNINKPCMHVKRDQPKRVGGKKLGMENAEKDLRTNKNGDYG